MSAKTYAQGDCKLFRLKILSGLYHKESMGEGLPDSVKPNRLPDWLFPPPSTAIELILRRACTLGEQIKQQKIE